MNEFQPADISLQHVTVLGRNEKELTSTNIEHPVRILKLQVGITN